jgi:cyclic pyranopterin phosphate synthase
MAKMVDVADKDIVRRVATAQGHILLKKSTLQAIAKNRIKKGDVVAASKIAGIQAAKSTSTILPLCHQIPLTSVAVDLSVGDGRLDCSCTVSALYRTGVEMEALVGVAAALLNAWDMVKYLEKDSGGQYPNTEISGIRVVSKVKGGAKRGR